MASITAPRRSGRRSLAGSPAGRLGADPTAAWRHLDLVLVGCLAAISALGVLMVYSATRGPGGGEPLDQTYLKRQLLFVAVGMVVLVVTASIDYHRVRDFAPVAYLGCLVLLGLVVSGLGSSRKGAQAWFDLGPFQLQPSEPTKLALIVTLAAVIAHFRDDIDLPRLGVLLAIAGAPLALIMLQPDLGTALVLVSIAAGILLVGGARGRHLLALLVVGVIGVGVVLQSDVFADYRHDRLTTFLSQDGGGDSASSQEERYNLDQSKIAIGAGGMFGQGLFEGLQTRLDNVPEQHTDFIFTAVGEELGFVGAATLLTLFAILCWRVWRTAQLARDDLGTLICVGVLCMLLFQIFENVGMTMGIMPITGIPLPFVSYGGSSTLAAFAAMGLVLNVHSEAVHVSAPATGDLWPRLEPLLPRVQKPARYIGMEDGARTPEHAPHKAAWLLTYPDTYEVGLPNQGLQILYEILDEGERSVAERAYCPWTDLGAELRSAGLPLFSVDSHRPAADFDILAFNLSAELTYTNVLECIDLAGAPIHAARRADDDLLVVVGGHCAFNPEPLADFVDVAVLGDGEEVVTEISEVVSAWKLAGKPAGSRERLLRDLAQIEGVYVPSLYECAYDGPALVSVTPRFPDVPERVEKRTIADLADWPYPRTQLVPLTEVVHDRLNVEVFRGCTRGCRFCQAGMITRPVRERPADQVRTMVADGLRRTGYDEVALTSLSTADFSGIDEVVDDISGRNQLCGPGGLVSVNLPSLRVDAFTVGIAAKLQRARRSGLTFAPEAGSWRLRQVINKLITAEDLYASAESAYANGWRRMKLYFLTGLPTETDDDTLGIAELARNVVELGRRHTKGASVTVSVGGFVPKPQTPFQWFGQNTDVELRRKIGLLRSELSGRKAGGVQLKWHDTRATLAEGIASRGDRRVGAVIETVWRNGGVFQEWGEHFRVDLWTDAMAAHGLDVDWYVHRHRTDDEVLPWDHLSAGLHRDFLWQDWRDALDEVGLPDCRWTPCYDCGACTGYSIEHVVASATPPAGGSQGTGQDLSRGGEVPVQLGRRS